MAEETSTAAEEEDLVSPPVLALSLCESVGTGDALGYWTLGGTKTRLPCLVISVGAGGVFEDGTLDGT